ncbi:MAG: hypothetical protein QM765_05325 [Myxococcales bacterium]
MMLRACAIALLAAAALTPEPAERVALDGAALVPPAGFRRVEDSMVKGSLALVPQVAGESRRGLLAAFAESGEFATATLAVGRVERSLDLDPGVRSAVASAIAGHFRGELDLEVVVDRPTLLQGPHGARLETRAHSRAGGEPRIVRYAFVPAGAVHYVLAAAYPAEREADFDEMITKAFESFEATPVAAPADSKPKLVLRVVGFGAAGLLFALGLGLWQRRRRATGGQAAPSASSDEAR